MLSTGRYDPTKISVKRCNNRYDPQMSCEDCHPKAEVTVPNIALLSSVGLLESYPILDTTIRVIGNPFEMILELLNNAISDGDFKVYFLPLH